MEKFKDANGAWVTLNFRINAFEKSPRHVLVICRYKKAWLLTKHNIRGLEFPGGKLEQGETLEEAARREVMEETGGVLKKLECIGEYKVSGAGGSFIKRVYYGEIERMLQLDDYLETGGPVLVSGDLLAERMKAEYSFIMKDNVIKRSLEFLKERFNVE